MGTWRHIRCDSSKRVIDRLIDMMGYTLPRILLHPSSQIRNENTKKHTTYPHQKEWSIDRSIWGRCRGGWRSRSNTVRSWIWVWHAWICICKAQEAVTSKVFTRWWYLSTLWFDWRRERWFQEILCGGQGTQVLCCSVQIMCNRTYEWNKFWYQQV